MIATKIVHLLVNTNSVRISFTMSRYRSISYMCKKLVFEEFGDPAKVIKLQEESLSTMKNNEVLVKFLLSPINPADVNYVQGVYPIKPIFPTVGGFEGVGDVVEVGSDVSSLQPGDRVIPNGDVIGTWRTCGVFDEKSLLKVPKDVDTARVAGLTSNPCTAYRMLKDFVKLKSGDAVIQNAANSACGQNVIQLSRHWGFTSINIVRDRPELQKLKEYLITLGADYVFTEEELRQSNIFKDKKCPKPKLALNAVGGRSANEIARHLDTDGVVVTYGGMSKEPVTVSISSFIFKNLSYRGFWMTGWTKKHKHLPERQEMLNDLLELMRNDKLVAPAYKLIPIMQFGEAFESVTNSKGFVGHKYILDFQ